MCNYKIILNFCLLILLVSCGQKEKSERDIECINIDYHKAEKENISSIPESIMGASRYILVKEESAEFLCQNFDKIEYYKDRFFILDFFKKKLVVCDKWGNLVAKVGRRGNGPGEYMNIVDFDVDSKGSVYCLDGQLDKLFIYDSNLKEKSNLKLSFEADAIQIFDNGDFLFALSSWNKGEGKGYKLMITDNKLKIKHLLLPFDEYIDDNYWISMISFTLHQGNIIYNRPIDNNIYVLHPEGEIQSFLFDFGVQNVPDEDKKNIEANISKFQNYTLLKSPILSTDDYIVGTLLDGMETRFFVYDIKANKRYEGIGRDESDDSQFVGYSEPYVISVINPIMELAEDETRLFPDSVKNHILHEGHVIVLRQLYGN